jgi:hypothetical protein
MSVESPDRRGRGASRRSRNTASCRRPCGRASSPRHRRIGRRSADRDQSSTAAGNVRRTAGRDGNGPREGAWTGVAVRCGTAASDLGLLSGAIAFDRHLPWFVDERREPTTPQVI